MTEASYTAWDEKQYVWPPPDGWYQASDGKWWPEGYGPPQPEAQPEAQPEPQPDAQPQVAGEELPATAAAESPLTEDPVAQSPSLDNPVSQTSAFDDPEPESLTVDEPVVAEAAGFASSLPVSDLPESTHQAVSDANGWATDAIDGAVGDAGFAVPSADQPPPDTSSTIVGSENFDASTSAATQAFGTGLMPPIADRPTPAPSSSRGDLPATGLDAPGHAEPQARVDVPAQRPGSFDDLAAAAPATSPPRQNAAADQRAMLDAQPKGSSRGLLYAILGVVALVIIGAALFFALGGDSDADTAAQETVATGPGSVNEPHPRVTGVVVFYPDNGVEQRWIVEVLEPVRDASAEFDGDEAEMLAATRIRVTNDSGTDGAAMEELRFNLVDASNTVIVRTDSSCPPGVEDFDFTASVAVQASVEGTVCWAIPPGDLAGLKLGIESSKVQGRVHIQLQ